MSILWPLDSVQVTGEWANSPGYYSQFGQAGHNGIDLAAAVGTPVYATDAGTVAAEGWGNYDNWMGSIAGIFVRIAHGWGYSAYAHLSSTVVNAGQRVERGQLIGYSGATGVGTGPHLHFETFPSYPNFGNGFAGRVNPRTWGLVPRGSGEPAKAADKTTSKPAARKRRRRLNRRKDDMIFVYLHNGAGKDGHAFAVCTPGVKGSWFEWSGQPSANQMSDQLGMAMRVWPGKWNELKKKCS